MIDDYIRRVMSEKRIPGMSVAVMREAELLMWTYHLPDSGETWEAKKYQRFIL